MSGKGRSRRHVSVIFGALVVAAVVMAGISVQLQMLDRLGLMEQRLVAMQGDQATVRAQLTQLQGRVGQARGDLVELRRALETLDELHDCPPQPCPGQLRSGQGCPLRVKPTAEGQRCPR